MVPLCGSVGIGFALSLGMADRLMLTERITRSILVIRGQRVLLDADLAALYHVQTKALNQALRRNRDRFPSDFVFQLTPEEVGRLRSQTVISNHRGGRRTLPHAFTEQGVAMLSSVRL